MSERPQHKAAVCDPIAWSCMRTNFIHYETGERLLSTSGNMRDVLVGDFVQEMDNNYIVKARKMISSDGINLYVLPVEENPFL